jgi:hypothetical protein
MDSIFFTPRSGLPFHPRSESSQIAPKKIYHTIHFVVDVLLEKKSDKWQWEAMSDLLDWYAFVDTTRAGHYRRNKPPPPNFKAIVAAVGGGGIFTKYRPRPQEILVIRGFRKAVDGNGLTTGYGHLPSETLPDLSDELRAFFKRFSMIWIPYDDHELLTGSYLGKLHPNYPGDHWASLFLDPVERRLIGDDEHGGIVAGMNQLDVFGNGGPPRFEMGLVDIYAESNYFAEIGRKRLRQSAIDSYIRHCSIATSLGNQIPKLRFGTIKGLIDVDAADMGITGMEGKSQERLDGLP